MAFGRVGESAIPYDHEVPIVCINKDNTDNEISCISAWRFLTIHIDYGFTYSPITTTDSEISS